MALESVLAGLRVGRLVVVGAQTDACVRSTLHGAFARGYDAILVPATSVGKNFAPRLAAKLDVAPISEIVEVVSNSLSSQITAH